MLPSLPIISFNISWSYWSHRLVFVSSECSFAACCCSYCCDVRCYSRLSTRSFDVCLMRVTISSALSYALRRSPRPQRAVVCCVHKSALIDGMVESCSRCTLLSVGVFRAMSALVVHCSPLIRVFSNAKHSTIRQGCTEISISCLDSFCSLRFCALWCVCICVESSIKWRNPCRFVPACPRIEPGMCCEFAMDALSTSEWPLA